MTLWGCVTWNSDLGGGVQLKDGQRNLPWESNRQAEIAKVNKSLTKDKNDIKGTMSVKALRQKRNSALLKNREKTSVAEA